MEQRQFDRVETSTETLYGARRGLDFSRFRGSETERESSVLASDRLRASRMEPQLSDDRRQLTDDRRQLTDDRRQALRTLFPNREIEPSQSFFETARSYEEEQIAVAPERTAQFEPQPPTTHLFVGGPEFEAGATQGAQMLDLDLAPSAKTMRYATDAQARAFDAAPTLDFDAMRLSDASQKPSSRKSKMTIAIYAGITAVVAALIVLTGALVGSISKNVSAANGGRIQSQITRQAEKI